MKIINLKQDNKGKSIEINEETLIYEIKKYFAWRKNVTLKRLQSSVGSVDYDDFIEYLIRKNK